MQIRPKIVLLFQHDEGFDRRPCIGSNRLAPDPGHPERDAPGPRSVVVDDRRRGPGIGSRRGRESLRGGGSDPGGVGAAAAEEAAFLDDLRDGRRHHRLPVGVALADLLQDVGREDPQVRPVVEVDALDAPVFDQVVVEALEPRGDLELLDGDEAPRGRVQQRVDVERQAVPEQPPERLEAAPSGCSQDFSSNRPLRPGTPVVTPIGGLAWRRGQEAGR